MQIFQTQNNRGEQVLLLLSVVFAVLLRNTDSNQRSSMANTEEKRKQTTKNAQSKKILKTPRNITNEKDNPPGFFHLIKLNLSFSTIQQSKGMG